LYIRKLQQEDVSPDSDFVRILSQLSSSDNKACDYSVLWDQYDRQWLHDWLYTHVIVAVDNDVVIGTGSIIIERKFLRGGGIVGHIEDVVVDKDIRATGVGRMIVGELVEIAKSSSCYKVILNCDHNNTHFYGKCGFRWSGHEMRIDYSSKIWEIEDE
tara:strand:- start:27 stop:500 length:474 start_codon:yes stop_codon:yes gene_type:complete